MRTSFFTLLCLMAATAGPAIAQEDTANVEIMSEEVMDDIADDAMVDDALSLEDIAASDPNLEVITNEAGEVDAMVMLTPKAARKTAVWNSLCLTKANQS